MASSTGYILAAASIVAVNETLLSPAANGGPYWTGFNWRLVPATAIAAVSLAGLDNLLPGFGKGLGMLALLAVFVAPISNGPTPVDNAVKLLKL